MTDIEDSIEARDVPDAPVLLISESGGVLTVTLNRPERRNAINDQMLTELTELGEQLGDRVGEIRAVVLRGARGTFCAGGDLKGFHATHVTTDHVDPTVRAQLAASNRGYGAVLDTWDRLPQVLIAAVEGAAMGGGVGLACIADVTIADADATFSTTETSLGLIPAQIAAFVVGRVGGPNARRLMLTGARITGRQAHGLGLVDIVADDALPMAAALASVLAAVRRCAPQANAVTKAIIHNALAQPRDDVLDDAAWRFADCLLGAEAQAGVAAFVGRREPWWRELDNKANTVGEP